MNDAKKRVSEISEWGLHERQMQAFLSPATELLFGGASEGGKSFFIRYALCVWCAAIPNLSCVIIRRHYGDVVGNHMQGPTSFHSLLRQWVKDKLVTITENEVRFNFNGSTIRLTGLLYEKDLEKEQGREKSVLVVDEATQIPWRFIEGLRGWVRIPKAQKDLLGEQLKDIYPHISAEERANLFPRIIYTANPIGQSVGAFRRAFITPREPFKMEKIGAFIRQYIPSRVTDNPEADPEAQRLRLESFGEATAHALITGDWNSPCGDFYPEYDDSLHAVPDFTPPKTWFKYRSFDWGGSDPACCYWWCVSDGEEFIDDSGNKRWFPRGAIIAYREWYICNEDDPSKGLNLRNEDIAKEIVKRTPEATSNITLTDRFPFADRGASKDGRRYTMADDFFENGCPLTLGNCARVFGWKQLRSRLQGINKVPMIYLVKSCKYLRDYIPALPYHDSKREDAAESGESTHACFIAGTLVKTPTGNKAIETLIAGDEVIAGDGIARKISAAGMTRKSAAIIELSISDGTKITCTPDHEILTNNGWRKACDAVGNYCILGQWKPRLSHQRFKSLTGSCIHYIQGRGTSLARAIGCIAWYGNIITAKFLKAFTFITETTIAQTIQLRTLSCCKVGNISHFTQIPISVEKTLESKLNMRLQRLQNGIEAREDTNGTNNNTKELASTYYRRELREFACSVKRNLAEFLTRRTDFATSSANKRIIALRELPPADVYCLTEPITHAFTLANGIVCSNCDAARLACAARPLITDTPPLPDFSERGKLRPKDIVSRFRTPTHKKLKAR